MNICNSLRRLFSPAPAMVEKRVLCAALDGSGLHRMAYTQWGDPANPRVLVCVHGLTRNGRDFDFLARQLSRHYRVVCPDVVGRGRSDWRRRLGRHAVDIIAIAVESSGRARRRGLLATEGAQQHRDQEEGQHRHQDSAEDAAAHAEVREQCAQAQAQQRAAQDALPWARLGRNRRRGRGWRGSRCRSRTRCSRRRGRLRRHTAHALRLAAKRFAAAHRTGRQLAHHAERGQRNGGANQELLEIHGLPSYILMPVCRAATPAVRL